ncbi:MAG: PVC-type heme-binding CxxCH protein [Verrucomicrobiaceae bacterium]
MRFALSLLLLASPLLAKDIAQSPKLHAKDSQRLHNLSAEIADLETLELFVSDLGNYSCDWAAWVNPTFHTKDGKKIPVTKEHVAHADQQWKDLQFNKSVGGGSLSINGKTFEHGLGTHAKSTVQLRVPAGAVKFTAQVGIDDGGAMQGGSLTDASVQFTIRTPKDPNAPWEPETSPQVVDTSAFEVMGDLEVSVWASTPHLYNPTNMDIDHAGRVWVAEGVNYRRHNGRRPGGDRIAVLQDTNGDGKCDSSHTFVQEKGLIAPLGVAVFDNVIYVSQPPELLRYTDVNRDLKFDPSVDKREVILTGFNARNHDHSLHSVTAGPDGKLYFNNGNCGAVFQDKTGNNFYMTGVYKGGGGEFLTDHISVAGKASDDGHVWSSGFTARMDPDGSNVKITGHGYRNSYEQSLTSFGDAFQNDNDDPPACRVSFIMEYGNAGYFTRDAKRYYRDSKRPNQDHGRAHWRQDDPGTMDAGDIYGGGSPTGVTMYENGALGADFVGSFLSCEPGRNIIFHYQPTPKGANFNLERKSFLTTNVTDEFYGSDFVGGTRKLAKETKFNFRPSDVTVGPDGAIYVTDWFDPRVGGHADLDDSCSGTIYRIAPKGFQPAVPAFDLNTVEGAITALQSPAINTRYLGFGALKEKGEAAFPAVKALLDHPNKFIAARAIWVLPHLGDAGTVATVELLGHPEPQVRIAAYRALRRIGADVITHAQKLANDPDPGVRRDIALSLRDIPAAQTKSIFVTLASQVDVNDKNALEAIGLGAANQESAIWTALKAGLNPGAPADWDERFIRLTWRLWPAAAVPDLEARASNPALSAEARAFAIESLAFINHRSAASAIINLADQPDTKKDATFWLFRNALGEWKDFGLMDQLKKRGIYDPDTVVVTSITVPKADKPKFSVEDVLKLTGDPEKGKAAANRCIMCHEFNGLGVNYGPNLKGWGTAQPADVIARALIEPSADIAHGFGGTRIELKNGTILEGLTFGKTDPTTVISTGGVTQLVPRKMIKKESKKKPSLMLSADQLGLTPQDVADLVAFLKVYK